MGKRAVPKNNVEYKFRFKKRYSYETYIVTLIYESTNEKGRYVFFNKKSGAFTSMPQKRFSYIHRFNLVSETPIIDNKAVKIELQKQKELERKKLKEQQRIKDEAEERNEIKKFINDLQALDKAKQEKVKIKTGLTVEAITAELKHLRWTEKTVLAWYNTRDILAG